jgi:hypothetical protein
MSPIPQLSAEVLRMILFHLLVHSTSKYVDPLYQCVPAVRAVELPAFVAYVAAAVT